LNRALAEDGWFDPLVLEIDEAAPMGAASDETEAAAICRRSRAR
jgi:hypothetical protein